MTLFLNCQSLSKSFSTRLLFRDLSFSIFLGDRVGLIGPNGSGKTTLLKMIAGLETPNSGTISIKRELKIGYLPQSCDFPDEKPETVLLKSLKEGERPDYEKEILIQTWLSKLGFTGNEPSAARLSGGWKKRLRLAQELLFNPDLLLLDEPTNHLDLEGILWLEKFLLREVRSFLLVSHDRYFLQHMTNRIIEINPIYPNGLFSIGGTYANFLEKKEEFIKGQIEQERSLASKARYELEWLRKSPKARTTKSQARVGSAHELLDELSQVQARNRQKRTSIDFAATERETRKLMVGKNLSKKVGNKLLFHHLDFILSPGSRLGLLGPNGSGKTTLLRLLAGEILPDQGTLKQADALKIVYFDQHRSQLPLSITLREALSPNGDFILFRGQKIHVNGWCKRFLFSPDVLDMPLSKLSGGERARILIAHLMLQPADVLLLDEPTNDLDIPTLETFEESLIDFPGAVVLITHDRYMLDRICNSLLALGNPDQNEQDARAQHLRRISFLQEGVLQSFVDYAQWEKTFTAPPKPKEKKQEAAPPKPKHSYAEKKEYAQIEAKILKLEEEISALNLLLEESQISQNQENLQALCSQIGLAEAQIEQLYIRWEELDQKLRTPPTS